jgi:FixJ family two-component response regulator
MISRACCVHYVGARGKRFHASRARFFRAKDLTVVTELPIIAIIEDDASVRTATQNLVRSLGFAACAFEAAEEFMDSPCSSEVSCLIADVQLPGMSGVELQRVLQDQGCDTPIIFITAFGDESVRARALNAGAVCFLSKPVDGQILVECLHTALRRRT